MGVLDAPAMSLRPSAAYRLLAKMAMGLEDCAVFCNSDSTGIGTDATIGTGVLRGLAVRLGLMFPAYTVLHITTFTSTYTLTETLQTGTGPRTLRFYNPAVTGTQSYYMMGGRFAAAYVTPGFQADLVILNHGHNHDSTPNGFNQGRHMLIGGLDPILQYHQRAGVIVIAQNPDRDDTNGTNRANASRELAQTRGYSVAEVDRLILGFNKLPSLYRDNIHLNGTGFDLAVARIWRDLFANVSGPTNQKESTSGMPKAANLLLNGLFTAFTGAAADNWNATGSTTALESGAGNFETSGQSLKLTTDGSVDGYVEQSITGDAVVRLRSKPVTIAVRWMSPTANQNANAGTPGIIFNNGSDGSETRGVSVTYNAGVRDAFVWRSVTAICPSDTTTIKFRARTTVASATTGEVTYLDRVWAGPGIEPYDVPQ